MSDFSRDLVHAMVTENVTPAEILLPYLAYVYRTSLEPHLTLTVMAQLSYDTPAISSTAAVRRVEVRHDRGIAIRVAYDNPAMKDIALHVPLSSGLSVVMGDDEPVDDTADAPRKQIAHVLAIRSGNGSNNLIDLREIYDQFAVHFHQLILMLNHVNRFYPPMEGEVRYRHARGVRCGKHYEAACRVLEVQTGLHGRTATVMSLLNEVVQRDVRQDHLLTTEQYDYWVPRALPDPVKELIRPFRNKHRESNSGDQCNCVG